MRRPDPVAVTFKDGTSYVLHRVLSNANHKQQLGDSKGFSSVGLILTPVADGDGTMNVCKHATPGCRRACFAGYDQLAWKPSKRVARARKLLLEQDPTRFLAMLRADLHRARERARRKGVTQVARLNVVSDVPWLRDHPEIYEEFRDVVFTEYTKDPTLLDDPRRPPNLSLTFSRSERNEADCRAALRNGHSVSVVFRRPELPPTWWGVRVIDGDQDDLRHLDPPGVVVGLKAKASGGRHDRSGFVIDWSPGDPIPE